MFLRILPSLVHVALHTLYYMYALTMQCFMLLLHAVACHVTSVPLFRMALCFVTIIHSPVFSYILCCVCVHGVCMHVRHACMHAVHHCVPFIPNDNPPPLLVKSGVSEGEHALNGG